MRVQLVQEVESEHILGGQRLPMAIGRWIRGGCLSVLIVSTSLLPGVNLLRQKPKAVKLRGRIVASVQPPQRTTVGRNYHDYLFEIGTPDGKQNIVRLSYRFMLRDGDLPPSFFDPATVHTFKALRDTSCDQNIAELATAYRFDPSGFRFLRTEFVLHFLDGTESPQIAPDTVLPCYVTRPEDYVGSKAPKQRK
jgi:hypothetical protein